MPKRIEKISRSRNAASRDQHRFEHWHLDSQVYFITARCRDKVAAFATEAAKSVFWDRFDHYAAEFGYVPWVTSCSTTITTRSATYESAKTYP